MSVMLNRNTPKKINPFFAKMLQSATKMDIWLFLVTVLYFLLNIIRPNLILYSSVLFIILIGFYFADKNELLIIEDKKVCKKTKENKI